MTVSGAKVPESRIDLYVSSNSPDSDIAIENLRAAVLARHSDSMPSINIVDVHLAPLVAYREGVFVTPTLIVTVNGVSRTMFGNLSNPEITRLLLERMLQ